MARSKSPKIRIGDVNEVFGLGEGEEWSPSPGDLDYYVGVTVKVGNRNYPVGVRVGIPKSAQGSARASGAGSSHGGGPRVWWEDSSDWASLPKGTRDAVLDSLRDSAWRIYNEAESMVDSDHRERAADEAERDMESAEDWYDAYGWHVSTEDAGDVELSVVSYDDLDKSDKTIVNNLLKDDEDLRRDEAEHIVAKAREVREAAESITSLLTEAIEAYRADDDREARNLLRQAKHEEWQHGDSTVTKSVSEALYGSDE